MTIWRWAAVAALLTVAIAFAFPAIPDIGACGASASWVAFQKTSSVATVAAMIRPDCTAAFVPALRHSMWLDNIAFIPAYTAFLGLVLHALRPMPRWAWLAGVATLAIGIVADQVEGFRLLAILNALPGTQAMIDSANAATFAKELYLSLATLVIGLLLARARGAVRLLAIITALGGLVATLASFGFPFGEGGTLMGESGLLIGWLALAIVTGTKGFGPARMA